MGTGVKMAVAAFNVDHKTHIAEITRFGGGIKSEEGDPAFIDTRRVFQVGPGDVQRVLHLHDINNGTAGFFRQLAELAVQFTHL